MPRGRKRGPEEGCLAVGDGSQICGDGMPRLRRSQELDPGRFVVSEYESARDPAFESTKYFRIPQVLSPGAKVPDLRTSELCSFDRHSDECLR